MRLINDDLFRPLDDPNPNASIKTRLYQLFPKYHQMIISCANSKNEVDEDKAIGAEDAIDFMSKMLRFSPDDRLTVIESLEHPFLESMHNEEDEPNAKFHAVFNFELEVMDGKSEEYLISYYKQLIWDEMREFHPELNVTAPASSNNNNNFASNLSPATIAYNYNKEMGNKCQPNVHSVSVSSTASTPDLQQNPPLQLLFGSDENHFDICNGPSSVATVITTKTNVTSTNAIREVRMAHQQYSQQLSSESMNGGHINSRKRSQSGVSTPMSPPTSLPSKRLKPLIPSQAT